MGAKVVLTRTGDFSVPLANRAALATALRADLFVSVHLNSMPSAEQRRTTSRDRDLLPVRRCDRHARERGGGARERGPDRRRARDRSRTTRWPGSSRTLEDAASLQGSSRLAYAIHERLVASLEAEDHGVKQAPFYVLAGARMPAVLLEVGFISHDGEAAKLRTRAYRERIADAVAAGVFAFRAETRRASR